MIRWIRRSLGTAPFDALPTGDHVVVDVRHLVDKAGNGGDEVRACIDAGVAAVAAGRTVVVTCDFGISRSNAIAAGILSLTEAKRYDDALAQVAAATGETEIKIDFARTVRRALEGGAQADGRAVLVTGASGFLGRNLLPHFGADRPVLAPRRAELDLSHGAVHLSAFCDKHQIGQIIHLAYPRDYTTAVAVGQSITMLRTILDVCQASGVRLVYVSGSGIFGGYTSGGLQADETLPLRPRGPYGDAKYLEQMLIELYRARAAVEVATCRLSAVYGPGGERPRLLQNFAAKILAGTPVRTHRYRNARPALDLLHVGDAARALALVARTRGCNTYHFGSGALHTTWQIAERIAGLADRPVTIEELPIDDDVGNIAMDYRRASAELGWEPEVGLDDGLRQTLFAKRA